MLQDGMCRPPPPHHRAGGEYIPSLTSTDAVLKSIPENTYPKL